MGSYPTRDEPTSSLTSSQAEQEVTYERIGRQYEELSEAEKLFAKSWAAQNKLFLDQSRLKGIASQAYHVKEDALKLVHATEKQLELYRKDFQENASAYSRAEADARQTQAEWKKASRECSMLEKQVESAKRNIDNSLKKLQEGFSIGADQMRKASSTPNPETPVRSEKSRKRSRHNAYVEDDLEEE